MRIVSTRTLHGPNVYHHLPVVLMVVDLEEWADIPSTEIRNFAANLLHFLPGLQTHHCSRGCDGGFVQRLQIGTYMAHIIEHIALELSVLSEIEVTYGKTRYAGKPGLYEIVTRFQNEDGMIECLRQAVGLARAAAISADFSVSDSVEQIRQTVLKNKLGPSAQALVEAAEKRGIPCRRMGPNSLFRLGYGKKSKRIQAAVTDQTSLIGADIAQDKQWTKSILRENLLPVPNGVIVESAGDIHEAIRMIQAPFVIKPLDGNHGNGVGLNLQTEDEALAAFTIAKKFSKSVLVEEMCFGNDYRVLVVNGKMIATALRHPPFVVGDGRKKILRLIEEMNQDPLRGNGHNSILSKIEIDDVLENQLRKQGLDLQAVPSVGTKVFLRLNANLSSGGTATDVTAQVHPQIANLCERAARVVGLDVCGIDLIHDDISAPVSARTQIIEVNAGPGLRMHLSPSEGEPRPVAEPILDMLYPTVEQSRIPILSVTGTNGKTTVVRMLHKIFSDPGDRFIGLTTTDGIWMGKENIFCGDTTGPQSSQVILTDPKVDMAILEIARGGLLRGGLAYDWSDVSVVTNIRPDHIGQDGIEDLEDLIWIKSLVAERVKPGGTLVLNADDEASLGLRNRPQIRKSSLSIFLYSIEGQNPALKEHRRSGGSACWVENGWIYVFHGHLLNKVVRVDEIPITLNGIADFQVSNALAAVSAALAAGATISQISQSLKSFQPLHENRGRLNLYQVQGGYVILDYGHNSDALAAVGRMLSRLPGYRKTAVFGLPGDRTDRLIESCGKTIATFFDRFLLKDDVDLRGRQPRQTPLLIQKGILSINPEASIQIASDQQEAIRLAMEDIRPGEIVGIFYEEFATVMSQLLQYDPQPIDRIPHLKKSADQRVPMAYELEQATIYQESRA